MKFNSLSTVFGVVAFAAMGLSNVAMAKCDDGSTGYIYNGYEYCRSTTLPTEMKFLQNGHIAVGDGCSADAVGQHAWFIPSPDGAAISVLFDQFTSQLVNARPNTQKSKTCNLIFRMYVPHGYGFTATSTSTVGNYQLSSPGTQIAQVNRYYFSGSFTTNAAEFVEGVKRFNDDAYGNPVCYKGTFPIDSRTLAVDYSRFIAKTPISCNADLIKTDSFGVVSTLWSPCGTMNTNLNMRMFNVVQTDKRGGSVQMGVDLVDAGVKTKWRYDLMRRDYYYCRPVNGNY